MACDHLEIRKFDSSMEVIRDEYFRMAKIWNEDVKENIEAYYNAWQSEKGWKKIGELYSDMLVAIVHASWAITDNYNKMKESGEAYAKSQFAFLIIGEIKERIVSTETKTFEEGREIIVDEDKISNAGAELKKSVKQIVSCIDTAYQRTINDSIFGYYSDGWDNPVENLRSAYRRLKEGFSEANEKFLANMEEVLEGDKAEREASKQKAAIENSDFSNLF